MDQQCHTRQHSVGNHGNDGTESVDLVARLRDALLIPDSRSQRHQRTALMTTTPGLSTSPLARDQRAAALASHLASGVRAGVVEAADALRVLRHELRRRNTNSALKIPKRSVMAQAAVEKYAADGQQLPKNGSPDALHADHVFQLSEMALMSLEGVDEWLEELHRLRTVVCVTAAENYRLMAIEKQRTWGWSKYTEAGVDLIDVEP